ncbi:MAG: hypothetical protein D6758_12315, partial [Gammaproteobacteria bacterium]
NLPLQIEKLTLQRPRQRRLYAPELVLRLKAGSEVTIRHLSLQWLPGATLDRPRLALVAGAVHVDMGERDAPETGLPDLPPDALSTWQTLLDTARAYLPVVVIDMLRVRGIPALAGASAQLSWSPDAPVRVRFEHPDGRGELRVSQVDQPLALRIWPAWNPLKQLEAHGHPQGGDWQVHIQGLGGVPDQPLSDWDVHLQMRMPDLVRGLVDGWPAHWAGQVRARLTWKRQPQTVHARLRLEPGRESVSVSLEQMQAGELTGSLGLWWPLGEPARQPVLAFNLTGDLAAWESWIPDAQLTVPENLSAERLQAQGALRLPAKQRPLQGRGRLDADGVVWKGEEAAAINGRVETEWAVSGTQVWTPGGLRFEVPEILAVVPVHEAAGAVDVRFQPGHCLIDVRQVSGRMFDGQVRLAKPVRTPCEGWPKDPVLLEVRDLSLARLVALENRDIQATGHISGLLPVSLSAQGIRVSGGQLAATDPGTLRVPESLLSTLIQGNTAMLTALGPLKNYHYSRLRTQVDYGEQGQLRLSLQLEGRDPDASNARPVHYNLNVQSNIMELLRSTEYVNQVQARIQDRLSRP